MTNFQWALLEIACLGKIKSYAKCPDNKMIITYEAYAENKETKKCELADMQVLLEGVSHHNDKWEIIAGGFVVQGKPEIPFNGPEGYNRG